jgi:hypothetical protein
VLPKPPGLDEAPEWLPDVVEGRPAAGDGAGAWNPAVRGVLGDTNTPWP